MRSGGPAYPLATPGARLKIKRDRRSYAARRRVLRRSGRHAIATAIRRPATDTARPSASAAARFGWAKLQVAINQSKDAKGLPGVYKLGFWYATRGFCRSAFRLERRRCGGFARRSGGRRSAQSPRQLGVYGVADQMVWRGKDVSLNLFLRGERFAVRPQSAVVLHRRRRRPERPAARPRRRRAHLRRRLCRDQPRCRRRSIATWRSRRPAYPIRDYEMLFELSYQAQIAPWWIVQPDLQYIVHPGGNVREPERSGGRHRQCLHRRPAQHDQILSPRGAFSALYG